MIVLLIVIYCGMRIFDEMLMVKVVCIIDNTSLYGVIEDRK